MKQHIKSIHQRTKIRKGKNRSFNKQGRYYRYRFPYPKEKINDLAIDATLRMALIENIKNDEDFNVRSEHLRLKIRKSPTNILIIFLLDASGSMGVNKRMSAAKGAIFSLLEEIYIRKDKICLITFSNDGADLVLPPTNSIELATEILAEIPTGGKTPLSAGLHKALQIAITENNSRGVIPLIILLSDGKQNIPLYDSFSEDQDILGELLENHSIPLILIDTDLARFNLGFAKDLAEKFNAVYYELERLQADRVASIIKAEYQEMTADLDKM